MGTVPERQRVVRILPKSTRYEEEADCRGGAGIGRAGGDCARQHSINADQLFAWRKLYQRGLLESSVREAESNEARPLPVAVVDDAEAVKEETAPSVAANVGKIHIEFPGRILISVESGADPVLVRVVLEHVKR